MMINICILGRMYFVEHSIHSVEEHWLLIITGVQVSGVIIDHLVRQCCFVWSEIVGPNNKLSYVHQQSNHLLALLKNILLSINKRLTSISSSKEECDESIAPYQKALTESGYDHKLTYNPHKRKLSKTKENEQETSHGTTLLSTQTSELTLEENFCTSSTNAFQKTTHSTRFSTDTR